MAGKATTGGRSVTPTIELPTEFWDQVDLAFEAHLGQVNEWTIPLPDELINAVREALKVDPTAKAKPPAPLCRPMTKNDPMDFRDTLSALLPPPRDDEPASLRQDILDELGDHLTLCVQP